MAPHIKPAKKLFCEDYCDFNDYDDRYYDYDNDDYDEEDDDKAYLVVNSLPQKKQRKNFIRPLELSVSLLVQFYTIESIFI